MLKLESKKFWLSFVKFTDSHLFHQENLALNYYNLSNHCRVVPDPVKVLSEIKANGGDIETVEGKIVAGDAGEVPAIRMLGNTLTS